ncbi:uncharacterized protein LOC134269825 [Saccostrea cucullata]|uniref:uncharacterized protein LOC134269825 n=1 Tax=Saccostrea cuccullata TaxID=36930 RepID=UPI002ED153E9
MAQKSQRNPQTRSWVGRRREEGDLDLEFSHKINCRGKKDKNECSIQKMCSFRDGKYVMFDEKNSKIKLFDRHFNFLLDTVVPTDCRDMTYTSENEIALTQQDSIIFVNVDDHRFKNSRKKFTIPGNSQCFGLVYGKSRLFVTCDIMDPHATLIMMDMKGRIKLTIDNVRGLTENKNFGGFTRPFGKFLAISDPSAKMGSIYLSDNEGSRVVCCDFSGNFQWEVPMYDTPLGIASVGDYVITCLDSNQLGLIHKDGHFVKTFPEMNFIPKNLFYDISNGKLLVTESEVSDFIHAYDIKISQET